MICVLDNEKSEAATTETEIVESVKDTQFAGPPSSGYVMAQRILNAKDTQSAVGMWQFKSRNTLLCYTCSVLPRKYIKRLFLHKIM